MGSLACGFDSKNSYGDAVTELLLWYRVDIIVMCLPYSFLPPKYQRERERERQDNLCDYHNPATRSIGLKLVQLLNQLSNGTDLKSIMSVTEQSKAFSGHIMGLRILSFDANGLQYG